MGRANGNASMWKISAFCIFEFFLQFLLRYTEFKRLFWKQPHLKPQAVASPSLSGHRWRLLPAVGWGAEVSFSWQPDRLKQQHHWRQTLSINLHGEGQPSGDVTRRLQCHRCWGGRCSLDAWWSRGPELSSSPCLASPSGCISPRSEMPALRGLSTASSWLQGAKGLRDILVLGLSTRGPAARCLPQRLWGWTPCMAFPWRWPGEPKPPP